MSKRIILTNDDIELILIAFVMLEEKGNELPKTHPEYGLACRQRLDQVRAKLKGILRLSCFKYSTATEGEDMNVATLELCKELYELSEWDSSYFNHYYGRPKDHSIVYSLKGALAQSDSVPAYDLGYLLRKLLPEYGKITLTNDHGHDQWWATDVIGHAVFKANTPEDALCKLAIELFKRKIIKPEESHE